MERSTTQLRTIATAMLIMGFIVELVGIAFLLRDRSSASAIGVMIPGLLLVMLGVIFLSMSRR